MSQLKFGVCFIHNGKENDRTYGVKQIPGPMQTNTYYRDFNRAIKISGNVRVLVKENINKYRT